MTELKNTNEYFDFGKKTAKLRCDDSHVDRLVMCFKEGIPAKSGWYLVRLIDGHTCGNKKYDVDYCSKNSKSDGGGMEWHKWYNHNISHYAALDT